MRTQVGMRTRIRPAGKSLQRQRDDNFSAFFKAANRSRSAWVTTISPEAAMPQVCQYDISTLLQYDILILARRLKRTLDNLGRGFVLSRARRLGNARRMSSCPHRLFLSYLEIRGGKRACGRQSRRTVLQGPARLYHPVAHHGCETARYFVGSQILH